MDSDVTSALHTKRHREQQVTGHDNQLFPSIAVRKRSPTTTVERRWYHKNLAVLSLSFMFVFTAFTAIQNVQSSLNEEAGLGTISISCLYIVAVIGTVFAPSIIKVIGYKWSLVIGWIAHTLYIASNFYPTFYTLVPTSVLIGVVTGPVWTANGGYLSGFATNIVTHMDISVEVCLNRFCGIFSAVFLSAQIWGNLLTFVILRSSSAVDLDLANATDITCGADFCPDINTYNNTVNSNSQPEAKAIYTLLGVFLACDLIGLILTVCFLDNRVQCTVQPEASLMKQTPSSKPAGERRDIKESLFAVLKIHSEPSMLLLLPLFLWAGVEQAFMFADYSQAFINCEYGLESVGFGLMIMGASAAVFSLLVGALRKCVSRRIIILLGLVLQSSLLVTMLLWSARTVSMVTLFVIPSLWGIGDGICNTQIVALLGTLYPERVEAAIATFRLYQMLSMTLSFAYSAFVCMDVKIYIALALIVLTAVTYVTMETRIHLTAKSRESITVISKHTMGKTESDTEGL